MSYILPDIESVDFGDPYAIGGYVSQICQAGTDMGMAMPDFRPTAESNRLRQLAGRVVRRLDEQMPRMTVADALLTVMPYDLIHRLAHMTPADPETVNRYVISALDAKIHGDSTIDEYMLFRHIRAGIMRRDRAYLDKPLIWYGLTLEQWYNEALRGYQTAMTQGGTAVRSDAATLTDYDILSRVTILLETDLTSYEGRNQTAFKQSLVSTTLPRVDSAPVKPGISKADNNAALSPRLKTALSQFLSASHPYLSSAAHIRYTEALTALRHTHPAYLKV